MHFEEVTTNCYKTSAPVNINGRIMPGTWCIRKTRNLGLWVTECDMGSFMLPTQGVYGDADAALNCAAQAIRYGVVLESGKWKPDLSRGPLPRVKYELLLKEVSNINWA